MLWENENKILPIDLDHAHIWYQEQFIETNEANRLLQHLINHIPYRQDHIFLFGKQILQPRLTCWMADQEFSIKYSGLKMEPTPWESEVYRIKQKVEQATGETYNSVLINYYRNGQDSMGWHADNEVELGQDPKIASVSLGVARRFSLKLNSNLEAHKRDYHLDLGHGSLLFMGAGTQPNYKHQVPKRQRLNGPRINLTFRKMIKSG